MSTLTNFLTGIANAIRSKTGETGMIKASDFATKISAIETGANISNISIRVINTSGDYRYLYIDDNYTEIPPGNDSTNPFILDGQSLASYISVTCSPELQSEDPSNYAGFETHFVANTGLFFIEIKN